MNDEQTSNPPARLDEMTLSQIKGCLGMEGCTFVEFIVALGKFVKAEKELYKTANMLYNLVRASRPLWEKYDDGSDEWLRLRDELEVIDANISSLPELSRLGYKPWA